MKRLLEKISKEATSQLIERIVFIIMSNCSAIGYYPVPGEKLNIFQPHSAEFIWMYAVIQMQVFYVLSSLKFAFFTTHFTLIILIPKD
jgi:hypothetical protein